MAIEIERKFLINSDLLRQSGDLVSAKRYHIRQAYLSQGGHSSTPANTVRVRIVEAQAFLTIKGPASGITRAEFEYPIPVTDAEQLLTLCTGHLISKTRYLLPLAGHLWEVDEFHGVHQGLWLAEIELAGEQDSFSKPLWLAQEVSLDLRYHNSSLAQAVPS
jgi:adenylate cyclase